MVLVSSVCCYPLSSPISSSVMVVSRREAASVQKDRREVKRCGVLS